MHGYREATIASNLLSPLLESVEGPTFEDRSWKLLISRSFLK